MNEQIEEFASGIPIHNAIDELHKFHTDGNMDALAFYITLTRLSRHIDGLKDIVKPSAIQEADKWAEKSFSYFGHTVEKKASPGRWDFKGVKAWTEAKANLSAIEEKAKAVYKMQQFNSQAVSEDGEVLEGATFTQGSDIIAIK